MAVSFKLAASDIYTHRRPWRDENLQILVDSLDVGEDCEDVCWDSIDTEVRERCVTTRVIQTVVYQMRFN